MLSLILSIGLTRRPGFELIPYTRYTDGVPDTPKFDPGGTWFEVDMSNKVNQDYIYFGYVNNDGTVTVFNQDGETQLLSTQTFLLNLIRNTFTM